MFPPIKGGSQHQNVLIFFILVHEGSSKDLGGTAGVPQPTLLNVKFNKYLATLVRAYVRAYALERWESKKLAHDTLSTF